MTVSGEQRRAQSYIYTYLSFPQTPVPPRLPRNIKQSSQCYTVSPCWLSTLNTCVYISQRRRWHPIPVLLPGESHGQRSLVGCRPWGRKEWDTTERLNFHFSLSCIGEGNGNPLQCSCLENPRDGGAWWAAVYGVTQIWTRLKRLRSSSSSTCTFQSQTPYPYLLLTPW